MADYPTMPAPPLRPRRPLEQLAAGSAFFGELNFDVRHFGALWHTLQVGQLLIAELNRIAGIHSVSIADFFLLGALMIDDQTPLRASDLALALGVSNAALSGRVEKLAAAGLLTREASTVDRRTALLRLTGAGSAKVRTVGLALEKDGTFAREIRALSEADRAGLIRIMGHLHSKMERDFLPVKRSKV
jgi:DNA-binding MarR family transcriptional regulator